MQPKFIEKEHKLCFDRWLILLTYICIYNCDTILAVTNFTVRNHSQDNVPYRPLIKLIKNKPRHYFINNNLS